ncbi:MAG: glucosamine-6-phosphate deaminase [Candidatus Omnitrophota bacterium]|nr:MAG: glucosamine-6-phosphate deaminase [Candidatus Omnitrophota bacterium]
MPVKVFADKENLGSAAADFVADVINKVIALKGNARVIFATGASQFEFLAALCEKHISWSAVHAFHLDEYVALTDKHPASFRRYLCERLFDRVKPAQVHLLDGCAQDIEKECERYSQLLLEDEIDLACIGIGENGHIAFNDPPMADFHDPKWVKIVELDEACRKQQLGEGWFPSLDDVPQKALTLTAPAILRAKVISCVAPDKRKAQAVKDALQGPVATACPASILRTHPQTVLWLDGPAASLL